MAGSDGVAVVSAIMSADDPEDASRRIRDEVEAGLRQRGVDP
jgi:thiamine monophosphate synthase